MRRSKIERHDMNSTSEYKAWENMLYRCYVESAKNYKYYGGRGIKVCDDWRNSFIKFYEHVGSKPSRTFSLDRINNDGNYEPGNVRWADNKTQIRNRRSSKGKYGYYGVIWSKAHNKWYSYVNIDNKVIYVGFYTDILDAAWMRDQYIMELGLVEKPLNFEYE